MDPMMTLLMSFSFLLFWFWGMEILVLFSGAEKTMGSRAAHASSWLPLGCQDSRFSF
jgi:hypothetical protein